MKSALLSACAVMVLSAASAVAAVPEHPLNTWVKRSPLPGAPVSPRLGYEGACAWDPFHRLVIRYGGHNQGGGGEQGAEVWTLDPLTARWTLKEPNNSPPGVCCNAQNIFDPVRGRYLRFPHFSGSHGWQWWRELYLNDSSVWSYDLAANRWRNLRPIPAPRLGGLRCASWDSDHHVVVIFGGEGSQEGTLVYDPGRNEWRWMRPKVQPDFRSGGNMVYDAARKVHVLFGSQFSNDPHIWTYSLERNEWRDMKPPAMPPTDQNDAVLTYDSVSRVVLALVKISTGKEENEQHRVETWAYDTGANRWTKMDPKSEPDAAGNRTRQLLFAPELNLVILENCTSKPREQQVWTYRFGEAAQLAEAGAVTQPARPAIVEDGVVSVLSPKQVELTWTPLAGAAGYHVERAVVEVLTEDQLTRLKRNTAPLADPSVGFLRRVGPFQRLTSAPLRQPPFTDESIDLTQAVKTEGEVSYDRPLHSEQLDTAGKPYRYSVYAYRIRCVNARGQEGGPTPALFTIPSSPQGLFSREDATACDLKWQPNPEKGLKGYRIYRMDGRWDKDPISRLTPEPVDQLTWRDATAGKGTRRYYLVAVDALGQEGFPSSPVWHAREWRDYYRGFIGEWHQ